MAVSDQFLAIDKGSWERRLLVSPKLKSIGSYVLGAGFASISPHSMYPLERHSGDKGGRILPAWRFVYITRGSGIFNSKSHQDEPIRAGDMIVVFPRTWHRYHPLPDTGWKEYWIEFDGDYIRRLMKQTGFSPNTPIQHVGICDSILDLFLKAIAHLRNEPPEYPLLLGSLATQIIAEVVSAIKGGNHNGHLNAAIIREARRWLVHDQVPVANLNDLASQLKVNYTTFRHRFKAETGISPRKFALEAKIRKASDLLTRTEAAPRAIAELCGINSGYFSKFFKKKIGLTPTAFRQRHRERQ